MVDAQKYREGRRLHPLTLVQRFVLSVPAIVLLMLPLLRGSNVNIYFALLYVFLIVCFTLPTIVVRYIRFRYWINPKEVVIRSGVFTIQHRNIPIERVQNIAIERSLLPRMLGIAKVSIETAGSQSAEGVIEYVSRDEADEIRAVVQSFKRMAEEGDDTEPESEGEGPVPREPRGETLFEMTMDRVLLSGVFRFSLLYVALFFSGLQYIGIDPDELADWITRDQSELLMLFDEAPAFLLALVSVALVALLSWLTGIVINLNRFYRFVVTLEGQKLQIRHGLLTVADRTVPLSKVQALAIRTNPLMKSFGWYALEIQTMGVEADARGRAVVVPFARWTEIEAILPRITDVSCEATLESVSRITIRRTTIRLGVILAAAVTLLSLLWSNSWWLLALLPFVFYYAVCHYRIHGFATSEDALLVRRGVFREIVWILPAAKFQVFYETASIFQRRLGVQSILVDMAGTSSSGSPLIVDVDQERAEMVRDDLDRLFREAGARVRRDRSLKAGVSSGLHPPESHTL